MTEWLRLDELERLLASVDVFEPLPPPQLRALARGASLERLGAGERMTVEPREHARRVIVLLSGRATVYEPGPRGRGLTLSVAEAGTVVGVAGLSGRGGCALWPLRPPCCAWWPSGPSRGWSAATPRWACGSCAC
jgi:CRP-like cAMP-binding protein